MNRETKFYKAVNYLMAKSEMLFNGTIGRFGSFILTKWNRNYFFLLLGAIIFLRMINEYKPIPILIMVVICSTIMILAMGKDLGKLYEDSKKEK